MSMEKQTISEGFLSQLGDRERVIAGVFTTYRFEPDFFEQEVIPLMLDQNLAFSSDQRIKTLQVREALADSGLSLEVFYDLDLFRQGSSVSPSMEYLHHGIRGERSAFHAKIILLLLEDIDSGKQSLCVGAGSANLSIAGWWENIECWHWERVTSSTVSQRFRNQLRADVAWLAARRKGNVDNPSHALPRIASFLKTCSYTHHAPLISWYGLSSLALAQKKRPAFVRFMREAIHEQFRYSNWTLEIISPYFAESPGFDGHKQFSDDLGLNLNQILIFLPFNEQGEALCTQQYYEKIANAEGVEWATWSDAMVKALGIKAANRTTHAKIYHFYNGKQSWAFIGSVNFTYRATHDNQEAGFLVKLPSQTRLLTPLKSHPDKLCDEAELQGEKTDPGACYPDLIFQYDWKQRVFSAELRASHQESSVIVDILSPEGHVVLAQVLVTSQHQTVEIEPEVIEELLKNSGFLRVCGKRLPDDEAFGEYDVLVQQLHWTHKPLSLPALSPQEILQIYTGLSQIHRNQLIELLKKQELREKRMLGESADGVEHREQARQFFAEYAELFHAFRNLRKRLNDALEKGHLEQVDYYLSGRGLDSLPTLLSSLYEQEERLDSTTIYLTLLCLIQIYQQPEYQARPQIQGLLEECHDKLSAIESSNELRLIDDDPNRRSRFFSWYREQFFREYQSVTEGNKNATD